MINERESAKILSVSGDTINIEANPDDVATSGDQGVSKTHRPGTPICTGTAAQRSLTSLATARN